MNKLIKSSIVFLPFVLISCGPFRLDPIEEIDTNETAFVLPLEGDSGNQVKFESVEFLEEKKVAAKRITIPQKKRKTGRLWISYEWIPTARVVIVDRTPVTKKWIEFERKDVGNDITVSKYGPIHVESSDSIGFSVGVNISAYIEEDHTATYLYYYRSKSLADVIDTNIRAEVQSQLSHAFGSRPLEKCKQEKNAVVAEVGEKIVPFFDKFGITITTFGLADGLAYEDEEIQKAINDAYVKEMDIKSKQQEKLAQVEENERLLSIAENERKQAEEFNKAAEERAKQVQVESQRIMAEAMRTLAEKWSGNMPDSLNLMTFPSSGDNSPGLNFLMPFNSQPNKSTNN